MTSFKITPHAFEINGRETYLLMGEIHYFRMPPEGWRPALERLKECGCNAVAYYVPWFVHQPQEDTFLLCPSSRTHTARSRCADGA